MGLSDLERSNREDLWAPVLSLQPSAKTSRTAIKLQATDHDGGGSNPIRARPNPVMAAMAA